MFCADGIAAAGAARAARRRRCRRGRGAVRGRGARQARRAWRTARALRWRPGAAARRGAPLARGPPAFTRPRHTRGVWHGAGPVHAPNGPFSWGAGPWRGAPPPRPLARRPRGPSPTLAPGGGRVPSPAGVPQIARGNEAAAQHRSLHMRNSNDSGPIETVVVTKPAPLRPPARVPWRSPSRSWSRWSGARRSWRWTLPGAEGGRGAGAAAGGGGGGGGARPPAAGAAPARRARCAPRPGRAARCALRPASAPARASVLSARPADALPLAPVSRRPQLAEAHDEVVAAVLAPAREAWRQMMEERPWEVLSAFFAAVDWRVRGARGAAGVQGGAARRRRAGGAAGPLGVGHAVPLPPSPPLHAALSHRALGVVAAGPAVGAGAAVPLGPRAAAQHDLPGHGLRRRRWGRLRRRRRRRQRRQRWRRRRQRAVGDWQRPPAAAR
jgi:hypothetical protein